MKYPSEKQMLASIFEAIMSGKQLNFERTTNKDSPLFKDEIANDQFEAFYAGFEFRDDMDVKHKRLDVH